MTFGGAQIWRQWAGHRTGGGWINPQSQPPLNRYYGPLQAVTATFIPEAGHVYEAWTVAAQGACRLDYWRWSRAVRGGPATDPDGSSDLPRWHLRAAHTAAHADPTADPTSAAGVPRLALHSRYDPVSSWNGTAEGAVSATDAVNISQNLQVVWPMGEPLDGAPPSLDRYFGLPSGPAERAHWYHVRGQRIDQGAGTGVGTDAVTRRLPRRSDPFAGRTRYRSAVALSGTTSSASQP